MTNRKAVTETTTFELFGKTRYRLTLECGHQTSSSIKVKSVSCGECRS